MIRAKTEQLSGWGNFPVAQCRVVRPERMREMREVLHDGPEKTYLARGLGRSYGDAAVNGGGGVILQTRLNRMLDFDPASAVLTAEGGVSLAEILDVFVPRGFFLPVTPGTKFVTLGGAIAADVHGKNHHRDGTISQFVSEFDLMLASGETLRCSRDENAEIFWATVGGMGLTGIITSARLKLIPIESAYIAVDYAKAPNLDAALAKFSDDARYRYSVAWIDCLAGGAKLGRSVLMRGDHATVGDLSAKAQAQPLALPAKRTKTVPKFFPSFVLNSMSVRAFNTTFYAKHSNRRKIVDYESFFYPLDSMLHWNRMYGKRGFIQYQATFPPESGRAGLIELLEKLSGSKRASFLAVLKTFGDQNPGMLSYPSAGHTLALDLPNTGDDLLAFAREMDAIVLKHGGRVYLAKDACLSRETFEAMYPRVEAFKAIRRRVDPAGRFASSQARRLGLAES